MAVYIVASSMVSAQKTLGENFLPDEFERAENGSLHIIEPIYKEYLPPAMLRRMSRIVKFSLVSAFDCLAQLRDFSPEVIITASSYGCIDDTGVFLLQMHENEERLLNPTAFIRSTHNAVGGQIALIKNLHVTNLTHSQKQASFETALIDGMLMLETGEVETALIGGFDEQTELSINLHKQIGCLSEAQITKEALLTGMNKTITPGEGAGFFVLSNQSSSQASAELLGVEILSCRNKNLESVSSDFLNKFQLKDTDIDLLIAGIDGTPATKELLKLMNSKFETSTIAGFKHLSGNFGTDSTFALWVANNAVLNTNVGESACLRGEAKRGFEKVLVINSAGNNSWSFMLLSKC
ncbi:MAG TPA: beta-ketoacyl synthase chain length factor [Draconibacterium sp.]|nr:beta-ketoacyl synthase chain length factor [Draconibacterium sp.]